jgi:hypothetical protein
MPAARRGRRITAVAVSAAVHTLVLTALALHAPVLFIPNEPSGPPEPIIPVLLVPRLPPPAPAAGAQPGPIRLHRRQLRVPPPELPVAPLPAPERPAPPPAVAGPATLTPAPLLPEGPRDELRTALRRGPLGCANAQAFELSRDEREACDELLAKGGRDAPFIPPGATLTADKRAVLQAAAGRRDADYKYRHGNVPVGATKGMAQGAEEMGAAMGNERSTAKAPF